MNRPIPPTCETGKWPACTRTFKRRGSLTIWFDPAMTWEAAPTVNRGRQPDYSDAPILTCLTMKVPFGSALRQSAGFVESLLRLLGPDRAVPDFGRCLGVGRPGRSTYPAAARTVRFTCRSTAPA